MVPGSDLQKQIHRRLNASEFLVVYTLITCHTAKLREVPKAYLYQVEFEETLQWPG